MPLFNLYTRIRAPFTSSPAASMCFAIFSMLDASEHRGLDRTTTATNVVAWNDAAAAWTESATKLIVKRCELIVKR